MKPGTLFVVALPIGNLGDLSPRAREVLASVNLILAEDTRHTGRLLRQLGIATPLLSYHEHNEERRVPEVLKHLQQGASVALVSDAGTPLVSDPGFRLVRAAREAGVPVIPVPGPSAVIAALSVSGFPTDRFAFEGFPPRKPGKLKCYLEDLRHEDRTLVFFESVHRVVRFLETLREVWGDVPVFVAREMTKLHETYLYGRISEVLPRIVPRGEFVVVVPGRKYRERLEREPAEGV